MVIPSKERKSNKSFPRYLIAAMVTKTPSKVPMILPNNLILVRLKLGLIIKHDVKPI